MRNISFTIANKLCLGCGLCEDVCPTRSIRIVCRDGENRPVLEKKTCLGDKCGRCLRVCPGVGCNLKEMSGRLFPCDDIKADKYIGRFYNPPYRLQS